MPIFCPVQVESLDTQRFSEVDYRVMGEAYATQNDLGRLCDERAYEIQLTNRLQSAGCESIRTQVPLVVSHGDFIKNYRLDLVVDGALYELKAEKELRPEHEMQLLNYMFLMGIQRAKMINFRTSRVQGKILATSLTSADRRSFAVDTRRWIQMSPACALLRRAMIALLQDWGAFLSARLYQEALVHTLGGANMVEHAVPLRKNNLDLGRLKMLLHAPAVAFRITALPSSQNQLVTHLRRLLELTRLKAIQWINLNHSQIELQTIARPHE